MALHKRGFVRETSLLALGLWVGTAACQRPGSEPGQDRGPREGGPPAGRLHVAAESLPWTTTARYPEWFRKTYRYRVLVGQMSDWQDAKGARWDGIPSFAIRMGVLEFDRGAIYPSHAHPAPEVYYVLRGTAEWTLGGETFAVGPGTAIHTPPNTPHQMINTGPETLELLYVWWAPGGDSSVLDVPSTMLTGWDRSPEHSR